MKKLINFIKNEDGQGMVEYGLIIGLIAIVVVVALVTLGPKIKGLFGSVESAIDDPDALVPAPGMIFRTF